TRCATRPTTAPGSRGGGPGPGPVGLGPPALHVVGDAAHQLVHGHAPLGPGLAPHVHAHRACVHVLVTDDEHVDDAFETMTSDAGVEGLFGPFGDHPQPPADEPLAHLLGVG